MIESSRMKERKEEKVKFGRKSEINQMSERQVEER